MKKSIYLFFCISVYLSVSLNGQVINSQEEKENAGIKPNAFYNLEEIKVRWKKAALENCPGVPCPSLSAPGPCTSIVATPTGSSSASVSFVPPTSDGGSPITGYIVTATSTPSAPAKRKTTAAIITVSGTSSPIVVTGLVFGVNYIFTVVATNAVGTSPSTSTPTTVTPCVLNTVSAASSSPTLAVNTVLTNITHSTTLATGIGTATGLPSGVTASWSANVITISGTPTATGSFSYEIPLTGGCGSVKAIGSITVGATPSCAAGAASSTPTLTVNTVLTNITHATTSATGIGSATGLPAGVTVAWSSNTITISGRPSATGTFNYIIPLTGTSCSTVNATGTITVTAFTCGTNTISDIDNNTYNTVSINTQCWTVTNLRVRRYNNGTQILFDASGGSSGSSTTWQNLTIGAHTIYANDSVASPSNLTTYGYLYNWYAAKGIFRTGAIASTDSLNICPSGWHVPSDGEWTALTTFLGSNAGGKMKSTSSLWNSPNTGADNMSRFTALPGGFRAENVRGSFKSIGAYTYFWSATDNGSLDAWHRSLFNADSLVGRTSGRKFIGSSVRCLMD